MKGLLSILILSFGLLVCTVGGVPAGTPQNLPAGSNLLYLPALFVPLPPPPAAEAILQITPSGGINASTYTGGSFQLTNTSDNGQNITEIEIDLATAIFIDMVFDPYGLAGDLVAKDFTIDSDGGLVGYEEYGYGGFHDEGYDRLFIRFNDFNPGESFAFSVDVDPTTIQGGFAPGPGESGSVSGLELVGAMLTVKFGDNQVVTGRTHRLPNSDSGSQAIVRDNLLAGPTLEAVGLSWPAVVSNPNQTIRIYGPAGQAFTLLQLEGGQFLDGLPGGGHDVEPFEANSLVAIQEFSGTIGPAGYTDLSVTLTRQSDPAGYNHFVAILREYTGRAGHPSNYIVLQLASGKLP